MYVAIQQLNKQQTNCKKSLPKYFGDRHKLPWAFQSKAHFPETLE